MPARFAIASVEAPWSPRSANSIIAASSTVSRRSSAVFRSVVAGFMRCKLSLTYNACQALGDPVQLGLGQPRVKRQRQRPFEAAVGARERPLVGIGAETVQRIRADLRLDPRLAQRGERLVSPVERDDVRLPAVP